MKAPEATSTEDAEHLRRALVGFRNDESDRDLAFAVGDHDTIRVLAAWETIRSVWQRQKNPTGSPWEQLWSGVWFEREHLATVSGLSPRAAETRLRRLVVARLVYPDGTISRPARTLVDEFVLRMMPGRQKGRTKGAKGSHPKRDLQGNGNQ